MFYRHIFPLAVLTVALSAVAYAGVTRGGHNSQGYLGVVPGDLSGQQIASLHIRGAEVVQVDHDGPAAKAGLRVHDIILQVGGKVIDTADHLRQMLQNTAPGRVVSLLIMRNGQQQTITATLADKGEVEKEAWDNHMTVPEPGVAFSAFNVPSPATPTNSLASTTLLGPSYTGALLETISPQLADFFGVQSGAGLLVRNVEADTPAATAGMRAGDIVIRVGSTILAGPNDWTRAIISSRGKTINVVVLRDRHEETLTLTPDGKHRSALEATPEGVTTGALMPFPLEMLRYGVGPNQN